MKEPDKQFRALLNQWREIEPKANFEVNVWRRIRLAQTEQLEQGSLPQLLRRWLWQPAMAVAAAVVVSAIVGSSAGVLTSHEPMTAASGELQFLSSGTLAGGYVKATTEGAR
jgi:hypothetical protein